MSPKAAADMDRLTDLALALPPAARELVAFRIWESLHAEESWPLGREQLEEIRRRAARRDDVKGVEGDEVLRNARARIEVRRR